MLKTCLLGLVFFLSGCTSAIAFEKSQRDFDHQVQYSQKQINENTYQVSVHRLNKARFERMSVFMVRHAFKLCQHYGYQIEVLDGVELFNDRQRMPNKIFSSLVANIHCAK